MSVQNAAASRDTSHATQPSVLQTANYSSPDFPRQALWCPDGSSLLALSDLRHTQICPLPAEPSQADLKRHLDLPAPAALQTAAWYPGAHAASPATYCFLRSVRDHPVALIDAFTGKLRASYPLEDHIERFVGPSSIHFTPDGTKFYCGYEDAIHEFDLQRPGSHGTLHKTVPTRRSKEGQKGVLSSMSICPSQPSILAAGSFSKSVGLYDIDSGCSPQQIIDTSGSGVSCLAFHPTTQHLFLANRQSDDIVCFDLRHAAEPVQSFSRPGRTNQRLFFGLDATGQVLASGDQHGMVHMWQLQQDYSQTPPSVGSFQASQDAASSVQFHPTSNAISVTSGSRHFDTSPFEESSSEDSSGSESDDSTPSRPVRGRRRPGGKTYAKDPALRIWKL